MCGSHAAAVQVTALCSDCRQRGGEAEAAEVEIPPYLQTTQPTACETAHPGTAMVKGRGRKHDIGRKELEKLHASVPQTMELVTGLDRKRDTGTTELEKAIWTSGVVAVGSV